MTKLDAKEKRPSRDRKNGHSAEVFAAKRREMNAKRGKQVWNGKEWVR